MCFVFDIPDVFESVATTEVVDVIESFDNVALDSAVGWFSDPLHLHPRVVPFGGFLLERPGVFGREVPQNGATILVLLVVPLVEHGTDALSVLTLEGVTHNCVVQGVRVG